MGIPILRGSVIRGNKHDHRYRDYSGRFENMRYPEGTPMSDTVTDAATLTYYMRGRVRDPAGDPGTIRRLKDVGYLSCTMDLETGQEFLKTTESGVYEVMINSILGIEDSTQLRRGLEKALGIR